MYNIHQIFQNEENRLPSGAHSLRPDCSAIILAETSVQAEDWLFHPTGITFKFGVKKLTALTPGTERCKTKRSKTCQML